ncbi:MAG: septal ring lytic transglycosylase RlpA family protein [Bacteroidota bacterium]
MISRLLPPALALLLAACGSSAPRPGSQETGAEAQKGTLAKTPTPTRKPGVVLKRGGGFYKDDGPADEIPDGLDDIPDAEPKWEPLHKPATKPYVVLGKEYVPNTSVKPYKVRGIASWYGKKFHGQKTSIGEPYDMFAMTAAHPTLALPSYVRVTSAQSGKSVIVRITDRGPFHADRVIDLSYTAAYKLGLVNGGSGLVDVEAILPGEPTATTYAQVTPPPRPLAAEPDDIEQLVRRMAQEERLVQAASPTPTPGDAVVAKGVYLQLGAFANADNAESLKNHLLRDLDWVNEAMRVYPGAGIHRLQLGPYASRNDADLVAEKIRAALGYKPTVVIR